MKNKLDTSFHEFEKINQIYNAIIEYWPSHKKIADINLSAHDEADYAILDELAGNILTITNNLDEHISSYKWMCEVFNEEQIYFIRHGRYRISSIEEAIKEVYSNTEFMNKYMQGLAISNLIRNAHAKSFLFLYRYINILAKPFSYLEIGPGHGLHLATALANPNAILTEAWDISEESLKQTAACLEKISARKAELTCVDITRVPDTMLERQFDIILISEVLEHLENPVKALKYLNKIKAPGGRVIINFPINSPAPDHIFLIESPEALCEMVTASGLKVEKMICYPSNAVSLEEAQRIKASVSCCAILI